ncbi:DUF4304 domain-containing protein [Bacillus spongiae]|uniref:DUF4304 domain-containing protein n=1 Tax=Bacillus spongiae TaxID=2683610 RepID=A0ABU8HKK9_9BACI
MGLENFKMKMKQATKKYGYRKNRNSFWKIENGFYKLIHIQKSSYGDYFFINLGIHPVGLPKLITNQLIIKERPPESECLFRKRIEQVIPSLTTSLNAMMSDGLTTEIQDDILKSIPYIEGWMEQHGTHSFIIENQDDTLIRLLNVVPILGEKAYYMTKYFSNLKVNNREIAYTYLQNYLSLDIFIENKILDFNQIDSYLISLLKEEFPY